MLDTISVLVLMAPQFPYCHRVFKNKTIAISSNERYFFFYYLRNLCHAKKISTLSPLHPNLLPLRPNNFPGFRCHTWRAYRAWIFSRVASQPFRPPDRDRNLWTRIGCCHKCHLLQGKGQRDACGHLFCDDGDAFQRHGPPFHDRDVCVFYCFFRGEVYIGRYLAQLICIKINLINEVNWISTEPKVISDNERNCIFVVSGFGILINWWDFLPDESRVFIIMADEHLIW